jgi:hypothetical protein
MKLSSELNIDVLDDKGKIKLMLDRYLIGEIYIDTDKICLDILQRKKIIMLKMDMSKKGTIL